MVKRAIDAMNYQDQGDLDEDYDNRERRGDLVLRLRGTEFRVHRKIVAPKSTYILDACKRADPTKRAVVDLGDEDHFFALQSMIRYLYKGVYGDVQEYWPEGVSPMLYHASVYLIARMCEVESLSKAAFANFNRSVDKFWDYTEQASINPFINVVEVAFLREGPGTKTLRNAVLRASFKHFAAIRGCKKGRDALRDIPEYSAMMLLNMDSIANRAEQQLALILKDMQAEVEKLPPSEEKIRLKDQLSGRIRRLCMEDVSAEELDTYWSDDDQEMELNGHGEDKDTDEDPKG